MPWAGLGAGGGEREPQLPILIPRIKEDKKGFLEQSVAMRTGCSFSAGGVAGGGIATCDAAYRGCVLGVHGRGPTQLLRTQT